MTRRLAIAPLLGIVLLLTLALHAPQRALAQAQIDTAAQSFVALGGRASDVCGSGIADHAGCALCVLLDHTGQRRGAVAPDRIGHSLALSLPVAITPLPRAHLRPRLRAPPLV